MVTMSENGETFRPRRSSLSAMDLDFDACYRAIATRDARFDGRFFTGVRTTGVYCRPICPAPTPRRDNVDFYLTAAAAQAAGSRPCLRCRPETSPVRGAWHGTSNTVSRVLMLIEGGALDEAAVATLAARLGLGKRPAAPPLPPASRRLAARRGADKARPPCPSTHRRDRPHDDRGGTRRRVRQPPPLQRHLLRSLCPPSALRRRRGTRRRAQRRARR
jgi:Metal binding domain of Ada